MEFKTEAHFLVNTLNKSRILNINSLVTEYSHDINYMRDTISRLTFRQALTICTIQKIILTTVSLKEFFS